MEYNVMLVDDSVMMRSVLRTMISKMPGFRAVAFVENGKKALEVLDERKDISLILLDIEMTEMDGLEFLRHAKLKSRAKVIIVSSVAVSGSPYAAKARALGADAIVTKPSGAVSLDMADKRGAELQRVMEQVMGIA